MSDNPDSLRVQLEVVARRIDRHLDNRDPRLFVISCQHRAQLLARLARLEELAPVVVIIDESGQPRL